MCWVSSRFVAAGNPELQDRAELWWINDRMILAVADGAGGIAGGAAAADLFMRVAWESRASLRTPEACVRLLVRIDQILTDAAECGESTGLLLVADQQHIFGASVGDSMVWAFLRDEQVELTCGQQRRPFLGSGHSIVSPFTTTPSQDMTVVAATDGLWKYTSLQRIAHQINQSDPPIAAHQLAELVRLPSGTFPDDVAIITCRLYV